MKLKTTDRALNFLVPTALLSGLLLVAYWGIEIRRIAYDKTINADVLQRVESYGRRVPIGIVVPAHNRWTSHAFIAEASEKNIRGGTSVLILDDHYRGTDPTYRSESGVIGDLSAPLICSVSSQAAEKGVHLDPAVMRVIQSTCARAGWRPFRRVGHQEVGNLDTHSCSHIADT